MIPYLREPSIQLGGWTLHGWGLMVSLGIVVGFVLAHRRARALDMDPREVMRLGVAVVVSGFLMAHVVHVLLYLPSPLNQGDAVGVRPFPWRELLEVWHGYSSFGGFLGAALAAFAYRAFSGRRLLELCDPILWGFVPAWMLARIGCFLAHDHRGERTDFFLAVRFPTGTRHDLGLYEAILAAVLWAAMVGLDRRGQRGLTPGLILAVYSLARFGLEELRWRDVRYAGLTPAQYGAIPLFLTGVTMILLARRRAAAAEG